MRFLAMALVALMCWNVAGVELVEPPVVEVTDSNAVIRWQTDVATGTKAQINPASPKIFIPDKTPGTRHRVFVSELKAGTTYVFTVGTARIWLATNCFTASESPTAGTMALLPKPERATKKTIEIQAPPTRKTWGNLSSLPDHFARHGADFHARDENDYARLAWEFLQRANREGLPAKVDDEGVLRVFDPKSRTFGSYNHEGTTKTFFKPGSRDYFERQPGSPVNLKHWK